jgi:hypothetical protein
MHFTYILGIRPGSVLSAFFFVLVRKLHEGAGASFIL